MLPPGTTLNLPTFSDPSVPEQPTRHDYVGRKGDLRCELWYADVRDGHGRQACLYAYHMNRPKDGVLIPFGGMWQFAEKGAIDSVIQPLARKLFPFCTRQDAFRTLDLVMDYLEDLKNHKPEPGVDKTLDDFLQECDDEGLEFFITDAVGRPLSLS
jgi:hypothetical protein